MIWKSFFYVDKYRSFWKNLENCGKNIEILNLTTEGKRNCLVLEPNYHTTKFLTENLLTIQMKKTQIYINKSLY